MNKPTLLLAVGAATLAAVALLTLWAPGAGGKDADGAQAATVVTSSVTTSLVMAGSTSSAPGAANLDPLTAVNAAAVFDPIFDVLDCEHSGHFQKAEIEDHFAPIFRYFDRDLSRTITLDEYVRVAKADPRIPLPSIFQTIDVDHNQVVSMREYRDYLYTLFELLDVDRDGEVKRVELADKLSP